MSGFLGVLLASSSGGLTGSSSSITNVSNATGIRSGTFALVSDGTFTGTGGGGPSNWFSPTTAGIGSSWSALAVINTTTSTAASGTFGSWIPLSGTTTWGFHNTAINNEGTGSMTVSFSPDGGTTTVSSMFVSWDVGYTS